MYKSRLCKFVQVVDLHFERQPPRLLSLLRCNFCRGFSRAQGCLGENNFSISLFWLAKRKRLVWQCVCFCFVCQDFQGLFFFFGLILFGEIHWHFFSLSSFFSSFSLFPSLRFPPLLIFYRFINARRRIVQPMIDQSNRAGKSPIVTVFKSRRRKQLTLHAPGGPSAGKYRNVQSLQRLSPQCHDWPLK